uniref:Putative ovule protein n=1 Tax=Solanum chacoense TaxID=4108 RepID=A0A0V0HM51_SOLCH
MTCPRALPVSPRCQPSCLYKKKDGTEPVDNLKAPHFFFLRFHSDGSFHPHHNCIDETFSFHFNLFRYPLSISLHFDSSPVKMISQGCLLLCFNESTTTLPISSNIFYDQRFKGKPSNLTHIQSLLISSGQHPTVGFHH